MSMHLRSGQIHMALRADSDGLQVITPPTNTATNDKHPVTPEQDKVKLAQDYILVPVTQLGNEQYAILHNKHLYQINNPNTTPSPCHYSYQDKGIEVGSSQTYLNQGSEHQAVQCELSVRQKRTSKWDDKSTSPVLSRDWMNTQTSLINPFSANISSESDEDRVLHDRPLFSALDNIHTQTENLWNITEFSTQTVTEQQSFGTQTASSCEAVLESLECVECDLVEYLDCCAQTDTMYKSTGKCFGAQTELAMVSGPQSVVTAVWSHNDQSSGVERSNMECQTLDKRNSTHTQTNMVRERGLQAGTHIETQTTIDLASVYNESFTQTQESFELDYFPK